MANLKITFLDTDTLGNVQNLSLFDQLGVVKHYSTTSAGETISHIGDSTVALTNKVVIDKSVIDACSSLKYIGILATGTNNVDLEYADQKGITVNNVAGYSTNSVAQHTFAMLLSIIHSTKEHTDYVNERYAQSPIFTNLSMPYFELEGKTLGIIGLGNIGKRVAELARAFGMKVIYTSTSGKNNDANYQQESLQELLLTADVVSIHAPLNENTANLISTEELKLMKPSAYLINTGRGGIIDEKALADCLQNRIIAGACIDVFENEPISEQNPLKGCKEVIMTPHIAWASVEARERLLQMAFDKLKSYVDKQN